MRRKGAEERSVVDVSVLLTSQLLFSPSESSGAQLCLLFPTSEERQGSSNSCTEKGASV